MVNKTAVKQLLGIVTASLFGFILFFVNNTDIIWYWHQEPYEHYIQNPLLVVALCLMILTGILLFIINSIKHSFPINQFVYTIGLIASFLIILNPTYSPGTMIWLVILSILGIIWFATFLILLIQDIQTKSKK
jgi:hypothetical protein